MKPDFNSIIFRLWAYISASVIGAMAALWLLQAVLLPYFFEAKRTADLKEAAGALANSAGSENFGTLLEDTAYQYNLSAEFVSSDGTVENSANMLGMRNPFGERNTPGSDGREPPPTRSMYTKYIRSVSESADGTLFTQVENERFGNKTLLYAVHAGNGYLFLIAEFKPVDSLSVLRELGLITVIVVIIASLAAIFIAKSITKPITTITKASRRLVDNEFPDGCGGVYSETRELAATLRQTAIELKQVENLRREFIANVSHDLRTPLTMIRAYGEAMRDLPSGDPGQTRGDLDVIIHESDRLSGLVDDLLDLSRMQAGHGELTLSPINLTGLIEKVAAGYQVFCERDGYSISFEHERNVTVSADEKRILQVMHNLMNNAIGHTGPDKRVRIRQIEKTGSVRVEVCNAGPGIPPDQLPHIWDRYFRGGETLNKTGNGLGLSIVKTVLELHGARYGAESPEEGGSVFWFELVR